MMLRTTSISGITLLFAALFYIFSPTIFGLYFLIAVIVLLCSLLLSVYSAKKHTHYTISAPFATAKNDLTEWALHCTNSSKWFTSTTRITVVWEHLFTRQRHTELVSLTIPAGKTVTALVKPSSLYSGQYKLHIEKAILTDALALFSLEKQLVCEQMTVVLPNMRLNQHLQMNDKHTNQLPNTTTFAQQNGDELAHLKLYHSGDSVKQIHWKLSSKLDELYVKQLETTSGQQFVLAVDATQIGNDIQLYDKLIEEAAGQLFGSVVNGRYGQLALYENDWYFDAITNELQAKLALQKLLVQTTLSISTEAWQQLLQRYPNALLLTTNPARHQEVNVIAINLFGKEESTDDLDY